MTNKLKYFIANWKMFGDIKSLKSINSVIKFMRLNRKKKFKLIYCPPYTLLNAFNKKIKKTNIQLGAQNCHHENSYGAYTGSISSKMIRNLGAKFVIVGHSENRQSGESDILINNKIRSALKNNLSVIFCVGETYKEKRKKLTKKILRSQILKGLRDIKPNSKIILAYEPVWSIGTGILPKNEELNKNIIFIRSIIKKNTNLKKIKIIYGGSVNPNNINNLNSINSIDGYLIGGASQSSKKLIDIVRKSFI